MSKYNSNAGFKPIYQEIHASEEYERSPITRKTLMLILIFAVLVLTGLIFAFSAFASGGNVSTPDEIPMTTRTQETFDYNELFKVTEPPTVNNTISDMALALEKLHKTQTTTHAQNENNNNSSNNADDSSSKNEEKSENNNDSSKSNDSGDSRSYDSDSNYSDNGNDDSDDNYSGGGDYYYGGGGNSGGSSKSSVINVTDISISSGSVSLYVGDTTTVYASVSPSNASNTSITWTTSNASIASVNKGTISANKAGTATIYAVSNNGIRASCTVTVKEKSSSGSSVYLSPGDKTIRVNQEQVTITLHGASKCTWSESNPFVVRVLSKGDSYYAIQGSKKGVTNIIATLPDGREYKIKITVV